MAPRGEVGILVATIGIATVVNGTPILSDSLFAVVVFMSIATTLIAPPLLVRAFKKKHQTEGAEAPAE